jgi:CheY-like chemotaxis protein
MIINAAHRAKDLVEQILIFSRQVEKEQRPLRLHLVVKEVVKLLRPTIPSTIEIVQRIDSTCHHVLADATQMHQVIMNLCVNAFHAMEEKGGTLAIELQHVNINRATAGEYPHLKDADYVCLSISDTGIGMDKATSDRIFEPFFTTKAPGKGTGMGLSVVHGIVRSHNGDILVASEPGKGTTFHVYLPTTDVEQNGATVKAVAIEGGHERVLVVDDEVAVARMMNRMLAQLGYRADVCHSSLEALNVFRQHPAEYDLVISDLTMPGMTGLDLAKQLHEMAKEMPIILMTGYGKGISAEDQKEHGITKIIGKPILIKDLALAIREAIDK